MGIDWASAGRHCPAQARSKRGGPFFGPGNRVMNAQTAMDQANLVTHGPARPSARVCELKDCEDMLDALVVGQVLLAHKEGGEQRHRLALAGWVPLSYLLLLCPRGLALSGHLAPGDILVCRYVLRGRVFAFSAEVLSLWREPGLVMLAWPQKMARVGLAAEPRLPVRIPGWLHLPAFSDQGEELELAMLVADLSRSGCQVRCEHHPRHQGLLAPGRRVLVSFPLPGTELRRLPAEVRNLSLQDGAITVGLCFAPGDPARLRDLHRLLAVQIVHAA